jgi:hypothetical protein
MEQLKACTTQIEGDEMHSDSLKTYVISKGKMAQIIQERPADGKELLDFFKTHADMVLDNQKDVPVVMAKASAPM